METKKISLKNKSLSDIFFDVYLLASRKRLPFFCTRIIRIIFLHTDLTERTDFIRFIRGAKNILCVIDERVLCGNLIHGIDGIGMRCDT